MNVKNVKLSAPEIGGTMSSVAKVVHIRAFRV